MKEKLLQILKDTLENEGISQNVSQENCDEWDSMAHLNIIIAIEDEFDVSVEPDDIVRLSSFDDLCNYINKVKK
jgi:acyl carrier protein